LLILVGARGFEPPTPSLPVSFSCFLEIACGWTRITKNNKNKHLYFPALPLPCYRFICGGDPVATPKEIMPNLKLGRRTLVCLPTVVKTTVFYDTDLTGFGLKA
jgi:hypothetical protein